MIEQSTLARQTSNRPDCDDVERSDRLARLAEEAAPKGTRNQKAIEMAHKLSAQLRAAEDRIRQLEATVRHHVDRADRAEKWLYQISMEIEQKFFGSDNDLPPQNQRR